MTQVPTFNFPPSPWPGNTAIPAIAAMIAALRDDNDGPSAPPSPVPFMRWRDTSVTPPVLRFRNAANTAWLDVASEAGATTVGRSLLTAANVQAALLALGGTLVGRSLFAAADAPAAQSIIGGTLLGRSIFTSPDGATVRSTIGAPALPAASGVGSWVNLFAPDGTALSLPSGGSWAYKVTLYTPAGAYAGSVAGVAAGGSSITGTATIKDGFAWRIA